MAAVGDKRVVHNYGHGGSGWSLSWGAGTIAARNALSGGERDIAVLGAGALGLTTATLLQQAGANVTIYARERMIEDRSARATGTWSPDSRIAAEGSTSPEFAARWEEMTRISYRTFQTWLGLPGDPGQWQDRYVLLDEDRGPGAEPPNADPFRFATFGDRVPDLRHRSRVLAPGSHPFPVASVRRGSAMQFNIAAYARLLTSEFLMAGGRIETMTFHTPADLAVLKQKVVVNCTGYGARALWKDETVVPYRTPEGWAPFTVRNETIRVKGQADVALKVRSTRHGPVLSDAQKSHADVLDLGKYVLALRWSALDADNQTVLPALPVVPRVPARRGRHTADVVGGIAHGRAACGLEADVALVIGRHHVLH
eukprot:gene32939-44061_t